MIDAGTGDGAGLQQINFNSSSNMNISGDRNTD